MPWLLLFFSGLAALVYQIVWIKQLSLVVGVDLHAVSTAVSAFFAGLALGGWLFGARADRTAQPMRLYAWLEIGVAVLGIGATLALANAAPLFARLEAQAGIFAWALPFVLVGLPAVLMGGTLPVLMRAVVSKTGEFGKAGGLLYAANTAGAIAGALLTSFAFIPAFGVRGAAFAAALLNILVAVVAFVLARRAPPLPVGETARPEPDTPASGDTGKTQLALWLYAICGGLALGYEVIWSQAIVQWTDTRTFAFSVVLATYLTGLMLGSAWGARRADRSADPWGRFGLLIAAAGLSALLLLALAGNWLPSAQAKAAALVTDLTHRKSLAMSARFFVAAGWMVLVPTFFLGAAFPCLLRLTGDASRPGRSTGAVIALNTLGGIVGTLVTGFLLVPRFGLERSLGTLAVLAAIIGGLAVFRGIRVTPLCRRMTLGCGAVAVIAALLIRPDHLARLIPRAKGGELIFHQASPGGTVAVMEETSGANRKFRRLYIQGVSNSGDAVTSLRYMRLQALLPLIIHRGEPKSALVIALGTGITAGSLLHYPGLEKRVCAELLPAVVQAVPLFSGNAGVTTDSRVEIRVRDGRRELLRNADRYDMITLEPPPPSAAGVVNLYSSDFYQLAATRLNPSGLVAQWLPLPTQTDADTRSLVRSFLDVFPHATLWTTELHEMLLIGSPDPIELDAARIAGRIAQPETAAALKEVGINNAAALLATWVTDRAGLERYATGALATTDDRPRIEYGEWTQSGEFIKTLLTLNDLRVVPPLTNADAPLRDAIEKERDILLTFYESGIYAYQRDQKRWRKAFSYALRKDPENPYYRWFTNASAGDETP